MESKSTFSKRSFFMSGILLTAVGIAMRSAALLFGAFISRAVGAEGVGLYTLVMTVYSFAVTLATSGVSLTVTRLVAAAIGEGREGEVGRVLRGAALYALIFGIVSSAVLLLGSDFIAAHLLYDERTSAALKLLALSLIPAALSSVFSGYFVGVRRVGFNAMTQVAAQAVKMISTAVLVTCLAPRGLSYAIAALAVGISATEIFTALVSFLEYLVHRRAASTRTSRRPALFAVFKNAMPLALSQYVRSVLLSLEHMLIPERLLERGEKREEAYSHYGSLHGMALPVILYPMAPLSSFSGLLVPEFASDIASGNRARMQRIAERAVNATLSYAIVIMLFLSSFSEELGFVLYRSYDAGHYIAILAPIIPIMYLDHVTDAMLKGIGEQVFSMWVNISDSALSIILVWLLIPRLGIAGYALVIVIMEGYNFALSVLRLRKRVKLRFSLLRAVLLPLLSASAALALTDRILAISSGAGAGWIVAKMAFALAVFALVRTFVGSMLEKYSKKMSLN